MNDHRATAMTAIAALVQKITPSTEQRVCRADLVSVESLADMVLSPQQLDAIAKIQESIVLIAELEQRVNTLAISEQLGVQLFMPQVGRLWGDLENRLFDSGVAAARLHNGATVQPSRRVAA